MTQPEVADLDPTPVEPAPTQVLLHLDQVDKRYPGVHALKGVSLEVHAGRVHAIVGENGAGKSTLVGVAAGSVQADSGSVEINGLQSDTPSPEWAREAGLAIVYQEPALLPDLTVAENMALAMPRATRPAMRDQVAWARDILGRWSAVARIDPTLPVRELRPDARFVVEISRALTENLPVLILDEPTEHLLPAAVEELFTLIGEHVRSGGAVVYISHRLGEVMRIADTVSVLRDGALVGTMPREKVTEQDVVNLVVGHEVVPGEHRAGGDEVAQAERLTVRGSRVEPSPTSISRCEPVRSSVLPESRVKVNAMSSVHWPASSPAAVTCASTARASTRGARQRPSAAESPTSRKIVTTRASLRA